jgi:hypothetical protein
MTNKRFLLGMLVIALVFGMMFIGCKDGSGDVEKTIVVQEIPTDIYTSGGSGGSIGLFLIGTTLTDTDLVGTPSLTSLTGCVAGTYRTNHDVEASGSGPFTLKMPLYKPDGTNRWTGSGIFDIYVQLGTNYYKSSSYVIITSEITYMPWSLEAFP